MTKYFLDEEKIISGHFDSGQIEHYTKELGSRLKAVIYLWAFNNFHTNRDEVSKDLGRPMYRNLAEKLSKILHKDYMQHDKAAYTALCEKWLKQQAEINRLREALSDCYEQASNWGACAELPIVIIDICGKVLNGESEE